MSVGATLRGTRERRGMSLESLAESTKINIGILRALENDDLEKMPALIYSRGFVKTYAREIGLDPDDTAEQYFAQFAIEPTPDASAVASEPPLDYDRQPMSLNGGRRPHSLAAIVTTALIIGGIYLAFTGWQRWSTERAEATRVVEATPQQTETPAQPAVPSPVAADVAKASVTIPPAGEVLRFELKAGGPCWISATIDGQRVESKLLQAGEAHAIDVRDELTLRIGDPGALAYSIDGVTGRALGDPGRPVTVKITRENYREFLRP
jgi:cytoskeleton protein RodZ